MSNTTSSNKINELIESHKNQIQNLKVRIEKVCKEVNLLMECTNENKEKLVKEFVQLRVNNLLFLSKFADQIDTIKDLIATRLNNKKKLKEFNLSAQVDEDHKEVIRSLLLLLFFIEDPNYYYESFLKEYEEFSTSLKGYLFISEEEEEEKKSNILTGIFENKSILEKVNKFRWKDLEMLLEQLDKLYNSIKEIEELSLQSYSPLFK